MVTGGRHSRCGLEPHGVMQAGLGTAGIAFLTLGDKVPFCDFHVKVSASAFGGRPQPVRVLSHGAVFHLSWQLR